MLIDAALRLLSPEGRRARLSILIFHRVVARPDDLHSDLPDTVAFDRTLTWLARWFNVLPLDEAVSRLVDQTLPARAAAITFDDGYADNATCALPVLQRHGLPATFFIATSFLDGGRMWNDTVAEAIRRCPATALDLGDLGLGQHRLDSMGAKQQAVSFILRQAKYLPFEQRQHAVEAIAARVGARLPDDLMMTSRQIRQLRDAGMQIGAHTVSHPILARLDHETARREINGSKQMLEDLLQQAVTLFAYPNGTPEKDYRAEHATLIRQAGFACAVTTAAGAASAADDRYQLPRFTPWDTTRFRFGLRMARNLTVANTMA